MELLLLESAGLAPDAVLSVRAGGSRRQQPLPCSAPFALPRSPAVINVEALGWCAWSRPDLTMAESLTDDGLCKVPLENEHGRPMSVTFRVKRTSHQKSVAFTDDAGASVSAAEEQQILESKLQKKIKKEISIDSYMKKHGVNDFMREVFRRLTQEQPEDPYAFIAACLRQEAGLPKLQDPPPLYRPPSLKPVDEESAPKLKSTLVATEAGTSPSHSSTEHRRFRLQTSPPGAKHVIESTSADEASLARGAADPSPRSPQKLNQNEPVSADRGVDKAQTQRSQKIVGAPPAANNVLDLTLADEASLAREASDPSERRGPHSPLRPEGPSRPQLIGDVSTFGKALPKDDGLAEADENASNEFTLQFDGINLKEINQDLFKDELRRRFSENGLSSSQAELLEIELRAGSVWAIVQGPVDIMSKARSVDPQKLPVMGCVPKITTTCKKQAQETDDKEPPLAPEIANRGQDETAVTPISKQLQRNPALFTGDRPVQLRKRARETLIHAQRDGRLATLVAAIANSQQNGSSGSISSTRASQLRKHAGETLARAKEDGRLASSLDKLQQRPSSTKTDHVAKLRKRAQHVLVKAYQNGTLGAAFAKCQQRSCNVSLAGGHVLELRNRARQTLGDAKVDGRLSEVIGGLQQQSASNNNSEKEKELRVHACNSLARAHVDGRLVSALEKPRQLQSSDAAIVGDFCPEEVSSDTDHITSLHKRARRTLAQAHRSGKLATAIAKCTDHGDDTNLSVARLSLLRKTARDTLVRAKADGRLADALGRLQQQPTSSKPHEHLKELRARARHTLAQAHMDGRLFAALEKPQQRLESDDAAIASVSELAEEVQADASVDRKLSLRKRAQCVLALAQKNGRLSVAIDRCRDQKICKSQSGARVRQLRKHARDMLVHAHEDGRLAGVLDRLQQQPNDSKRSQHVKKLRAHAYNTLAQAYIDGRLLASLEKPQQCLDDSQPAITNGLQVDEELQTPPISDRVAHLRKRARRVLERAHRSGKLEVAVAKCQLGNSNARIPTADSAQLPERVKALRARARETLAQAQRDGRLADVSDTQAPGLAASSGLTQEEAQRTASLRRRARVMLAEAQRSGQLRMAIELLLPEQDAPMPQILPSIVQPERRPAPQPLVSPEASEAFSAEAPAAGVDARKYSWASSLALTPSLDGEASSDYQDQLRVRTSSFNEPTTPGTYFLPSPTAWVLMDGESSGEEAEVVPTPRLTQFTPAPPVRRVSSQATTIESDHLSQFIPDRTAHAHKEESAGALATLSLSQFMPPGHDHASRLPSPARYQEITPRMSHFMPGQDPSTPRLTQLVPDMALTARVSSFGVTGREMVGLATGIGQALLTPRLTGFSPESFDPMMAVTGSSHLGPPQLAEDPFGGAQNFLGPFAAAHLGPPAASIDMLGGRQMAETPQLLDFMPSPRR